MKRLRVFVTQGWFLCTIVLLCAAAFRLPLLQYAEFKGDEALNLLLASWPLFHHPFPPAAQASSAGILNFPLLNYFLFPVVLLTLYPPTISFVIALVNVLTIGGFFLLFTKYHGKLTSFLTCSIIAFSPWAILYSRKIWAQDFLLPLSLPFLWSMYQILEGKKHYSWLLFGLTSMFLLQMHQLAIIVPLLIFVFLLTKKYIPNWKFFTTGIVLGLIPTIPYLWYMASLHFAQFQSNMSLADRFSFHDLTTFLRPLQIISLGDFHSEMGSDFAVFAEHFHLLYLLSKLSYLAYFLLPIGTLFFWIQNKKYRFFILVCFFNLLLFFLIGIQPLMHYFILLLPFFALFVGSLLAFLLRSKKTIMIGLLLILTYMISLVSFDFAFLKMLSQKGGFAGDYGAGFATSEKAAQTDLKRFRKSPNYPELLLFYYAPREFFHGYMPVGSMIFPYQTLKKNEPQLEKQFIKNPTNPLLATQVFEYYTQQQYPSWDYVVSLKEKERQHPAFHFIYQKNLDEYLSSHLKRLYETPDFMLLYPQHWSEQETSHEAILTDGNNEVVITKILQPTPGALFLRSHYYMFVPQTVSQDRKDKGYTQQTFQEILQSIRTLE